MDINDEVDFSDEEEVISVLEKSGGDIVLCMKHAIIGTHNDYRIIDGRVLHARSTIQVENDEEAHLSKKKEHITYEEFKELMSDLKPDLLILKEVEDTLFSDFES